MRVLVVLLAGCTTSPSTKRTGAETDDRPSATDTADPQSDPDSAAPSEPADPEDTADAGAPPDSPDGSDTGSDCPPGVICVDALPFQADFDTSESALSAMDVYACAPETDESGPELVFQVTLLERSFLGVAIDDDTVGVDVDAHLLTDLDPETCIDRGNADAGAALDPGVYFVVADTYVSGGEPQVGPASITIGARSIATGDCTMETGWMERVGDGGVDLAMPATGPIVLEAHLVTVDDGYGTTASDPWPESITESIDDHYRNSREQTNFVMARDQPWAPQEGCEYGQGASGSKLPAEDEGWYVNMYWADRPEGGTRMILHGADGRAVVVAAGYETGPGNLDWVGGTTEEVHHYLGTGHGSELTLGFALDQSLPLGPIDCTDR